MRQGLGPGESDAVECWHVSITCREMGSWVQHKETRARKNMESRTACFRDAAGIDNWISLSDLQSYMYNQAGVRGRSLSAQVSETGQCAGGWGGRVELLQVGLCQASAAPAKFSQSCSAQTTLQ